MLKEQQKILIVEDEESNYALLFAILNKLGYQVSWAKSGDEALEKCKVNTYQLIFMDIKMPKMNGYDAFTKLREMGVTTPIVAQTAYARLEDEEMVMQHGFDEYLSKPIKRTKLNAILTEYFG